MIFVFCNLGSSSTLRSERLVGVPEKRVEASAESHRSDVRRRMETWPEPCQITTTVRPLYLYLPLPLSLLILILVFVCIKEKWRMQHELNVGGGKAWSRSDGARRGLCSGGARWSGGSHGCGGAAERTRPLGLTARMTM